VVAADNPLVGRPIDDIEFPADAILAALVRDDVMRIPRGSDVLEAGDEAIVFALSSAVGDVTRLFPS